LGFDELVHNLWCSGLAFGIATGNAALALEGQSTEVGKPDLGVVLLSYSLGNVCWGAFHWHVGPFKGLLVDTICYRASIHTSGFYYNYKNHGWVLALATWFFIIMSDAL
jgi:hypothetical protein